jgi:DNA helicase HerA-like ATPase
MEKVGIILGNKLNTPYEFYFLISNDALVQLDEVVYTKTIIKDIEIYHYGIVTEITKYTEASSYAIETELMYNNKIPYLNISVAKVLVTRIEPEIYIPPNPTNEVYKANKSETELALYFDKMENKIPIGFLKDNNIAYLNLDFIDGTNGAHVNISGMSGIATKTTFATFLLFSLFQKSPQSHLYKAIIFNVKSTDLLYLNKKNNFKNLKNTTKEQITKEYELLDLKLEEFKNVSILVPPKKNSIIKEKDIPDTSINSYLYYFTLTEIAKNNLFKFFFVDEIKDYQNLERIISYIEKHLSILSDYTIQQDKELADNGILVAKIKDKKLQLENLEDLYNYLEEYFKINKGEINESTGTIFAFLRRFRKIKEDCNFLVSKSIESKVNIMEKISNSSLTVIDVHNLPEKAKNFVVSAILYLIYQKKEEEQDLNKYFFVIDELNKYAPANADTPIKDVLIDISERGRSLGIILIGAQQTASLVENRILSNCAIKVLGRSDSFEISKSYYSFLNEALKKRAIILKPGNMILSQPDCPLPIVIRFPYPSWATRKEEVDKTQEIKNIHQLFKKTI